MRRATALVPALGALCAAACLRAGGLPAPPAPPFAQRARCPEACDLFDTARAAARAADPRALAVLWEHDLTPGARLGAPPRADLDVLGVVLAGEVELRTLDGARALRSWSAFRAAGARVSLASRSGARLLLVAAADVPLKSVLFSDPGAGVRSSGEVAFADLDRTEPLRWGGGSYEARLGFEAPASPRASLGVLIFAPRAAVPEHVHPREWEHVAALQADGDLALREGGGLRRVSMRGGLVAGIPPGTPHAWHPSGKRRLLAIQVYAPSGPEQRFRKLAAP